MTDIRIVSASAGSGKTYQLAEELYEAIVQDGFRPEAVVVTTFTRKAAGELQERVRQRLLADDRIEEAQRLMAARIGTVHSVCHGLIRDFAFELGISPQPEVDDTGDTYEADPRLVEALADVTTAEEEASLVELENRLSLKPDSWRAVVEETIGRARSNNMGESELSVSAARSKETLFALLGPAAPSGPKLDRDLREALVSFMAEPDVVDSDYSTDEDAVAAVRSFLEPFDRGERPSWAKWATLCKLKVTKSCGCAAAATKVQEAAKAHDRHPALRADLGRYIDLVFSLAWRAMARFAARKAEQGLLDYDDLESLAYRLLGDPGVRERLGSQLDLVLVDEFQDTNPIQLAIFLRLATLARRSVWVGDQKQSIFKFRGADPSLMDTVLGELERIGRASTLPYSWRSRPELVALVSELFAPAFEGQGIPSSRVRLTTPPKMKYPSGLGAPVEHWVLVDEEGAPTGSLSQKSWDAVATGVKALLADPAVVVRDRVTGKSRAVRPADVAVLPFYRTDIPLDIAAALERQGIPAAVARDTLLITAEAQLLVAALRIWASPDDSAAAATIARLVSFPDDPGAFLDEGLSSLSRGELPNDKAIPSRPRKSRGRDIPFGDHPLVVSIRRLAEAEPWLGLLDAFDRLVEIAGLRELCRRWGDAERRLANLEALRAYVIAYADGADVESGFHPAVCTVPTPAGLIAYLSSNAEEEALPGARDAVSVVNWHRCKGLEWPIILVPFKSRRARLEDSFEVTVKSLSPDTSAGSELEVRERSKGRRAAAKRSSASRELEIDDPLTNRWIRCWVYPYGRRPYGDYFARQHTPMYERIRSSADAAYDLRLKEREEVRLLYVTLTRARDRLILLQPDRNLIQGTALSLLNPSAPGDQPPASKKARSRASAAPVVTEIDPDADILSWAGLDTPLVVRTFSPSEELEASSTPALVYSSREPKTYPPAYVQPSRLGDLGSAAEDLYGSAAYSSAEFGEPESLGGSLPVRGRPDYTALGLALHSLLAADRPGLPPKHRRAIAERLRCAMGVSDNVTVEDSLAACDRFRAWVERRFPGARWRHELPLRRRLPNGTVVRGTADLVLETSDAVVVIDHKAFPREMEEVVGRSAEVATQLGAYRDIIGGGRSRIEVYQHNPLLGRVVRLADAPE